MRHTPNTLVLAVLLAACAPVMAGTIGAAGPMGKPEGAKIAPPPGLTTPAALGLSPDALGTTSTGITASPTWYNFSTKKYTLSIQGKGAAQCAYHVELRNETLGKVADTYDGQSNLPQNLDSFSAVLPAGQYKISVTPGKVVGNNPNIGPCRGQASANAKVVTPEGAMAFVSSSMQITKKDGSTATQHDMVVPMGELKGITIQFNFKNFMDAQHNTPNSCLYRTTTRMPDGSAIQQFSSGVGSESTSYQLPVTDNSGIYNKGPGTYLITTEGVSSGPGYPFANPCLGPKFEHQVTLTTALQFKP